MFVYQGSQFEISCKRVVNFDAVIRELVFYMLAGGKRRNPVKIEVNVKKVEVKVQGKLQKVLR